MFHLRMCDGLRLVALAAVAIAATAAPASATLINSPVPTNAYVTKGVFDWAWAGPLPFANGIDLSYQSQFGWRLPTAAELDNAPLATDFLFVGANVPFLGVDPISGAFFSATNSNYVDAASAGAVATPYFNTFYSHADWQDGLGQPFGPWAGMPGSVSFSDQLVVRVSATAAVPEPATVASLGLAGLIGLAARFRRRMFAPA